LPGLGGFILIVIGSIIYVLPACVVGAVLYVLLLRGWTGIGALSHPTGDAGQK
jgi:hypothetical protein